jgi:hypothetical protein
LAIAFFSVLTGAAKRWRSVINYYCARLALLIRFVVSENSSGAELPLAAGDGESRRYFRKRRERGRAQSMERSPALVNDLRLLTGRQ